MSIKVIYSLILLFVGSISCFSQENKITVGFYNFENLFDTTNSRYVSDTEFTPKGDKKWTTDKYEKKVANLAYVISRIGVQSDKDGIDILGVAEIENKKVLQDVIDNKFLKDRKYGIVHKNSKDRRGIDVALIYNKKLFKVHRNKLFKLHTNNETEYKTRDVLLVSGDLEGEKIHVLVNHWPSRKGGEKATESRRLSGAKICKNIIDSIRHEDGEAKVIVIGDFNDNPNNKSLSIILNGKSQKGRAKGDATYNPMMDMFRKGLGSVSYGNTWSLFDQILLTPELVHGEGGYKFFEAFIFKEDYMQVSKGKYKGQPKRSFSGNEFIGGYSDHFPVYVHLLKAEK